MKHNETPPITIESTINAPIAKVWQYWTEPDHIQKWCAASDDWHVPAATNDLREGGVFSTTMAARDGSMRFEFAGIYDKIVAHREIAYTMGDGRKVTIYFEPAGEGVRVVEHFDPEAENPLEMQRAGWQAILDSFKKYTEKHFS